MKDLERARAGLSTRTDPNTISMNKADSDSLPSEELKLLEWHSENSEDDGFQLVSNRKSKKEKKKPYF